MQLSCNCCATVKIVAEPFQITSKPSKMHHKLQNANGWSPNPTYDWKTSKTWSQDTHNTHTHTTHAHSHTYTQGRTETSTYIHTRRHTATHINILYIFTHTSTYTHIHAHTHTHTKVTGPFLKRTRQGYHLFYLHFLNQKMALPVFTKKSRHFFFASQKQGARMYQSCPRFESNLIVIFKNPLPPLNQNVQPRMFYDSKGGKGDQSAKKRTSIFLWTQVNGFQKK